MFICVRVLFCHLTPKLTNEMKDCQAWKRSHVITSAPVRINTNTGLATGVAQPTY